jgi:hypothetical protein
VNLTVLDRNFKLIDMLSPSSHILHVPKKARKMWR